MSDKKLPAGTIEVWKITPHINSRNYDGCIIPVKDDPEAKQALQYAKDCLEHQWDTSEDMEHLDIKVIIKRTVAEEKDLVDPDE